MIMVDYTNWLNSSHPFLIRPGWEIAYNISIYVGLLGAPTCLAFLAIVF